ncbi:hypothetical protein F5Y15DRAFT_385233 [Xylariaceae sp. FL0016]|nr:hypothetical protein F5Y15DRAFT_385233 [Xylariaceae sp. FL0016]
MLGAFTECLVKFLTQGLVAQLSAGCGHAPAETSAAELVASVKVPGVVGTELPVSDAIVVAVELLALASEGAVNVALRQKLDNPRRDRYSTIRFGWLHTRHRRHHVCVCACATHKNWLNLVVAAEAGLVGTGSLWRRLPWAARNRHSRHTEGRTGRCRMAVLLRRVSARLSWSHWTAR